MSGGVHDDNNTVDPPSYGEIYARMLESLRVLLSPRGGGVVFSQEELKGIQGHIDVIDEIAGPAVRAVYDSGAS